MSTAILINVYRGVSYFLLALQIIVGAYCLCSWFMPPNSPFFRLLSNLASPIIAPFRPIGMWIMRMTGLRLDLSPVIAIFILRGLDSLLVQLLMLIIGLTTW